MYPDATLICVTTTTDQPVTVSFSSASDDKYRQLVEGINQAVFSTDLDGIITYVSPLAETITGFAPSELTGKKIASMVVASDRDRLLRNFSEIIRGNFAPADYTLVHKNGTCVNVRSNATPLVTGGTVSGVVGLFGDLSGRRRTDEILAEAGEKIQKIVKYSRDGILVADERGHLVEWNPAMEAITGIARADAIGRPFWDVMYALRLPERQDLSVRAGIMDRFRTMITNTPTMFPDRGSVIEIERPDQSRCTLESFLFLIPAEKGNHVGAIVRDVTDRVRTAEAFRHANRQLSLMTSITRHDITNKVTAILGYLCVAEMNYPDPSLQEYFRKMETVARSIQSQIEFTKVYEDLGNREPQWQDLDHVLPRMYLSDLLSLVSHVQGVQVFADPMLERVFYNLLDNTTRHGQKATVILISASRSGKGLVIRWEDDGVGIPAYEKDRIFERGFGKNTGLGLFLVREILLLTGISIRETGEPGKGARFEILVPEGAFRLPAHK